MNKPVQEISLHTARPPCSARPEGIDQTSRPAVPAEGAAAAAARAEEPAPVLLVAVWLGLVAGLAESGVLAFRKIFQQELLFLGPHFVWMAPVADGALLGVVGLGLALAARKWPRLASPPRITLVLAFLALSTVLTRVTEIHRLAALVLAAGAATQVGRAIAIHPRGFRTLVRRSVGPVGAAVLALVAGVHVWLLLSEALARAHLASPPTRAANVLLLVLDTVSARNLGLYGYRRDTTPGLGRFAASGVRFERALVTAPWTGPSHGSMFTGRLPHELSVDWDTPLDESFPTLAEALRDRGYATAAFVGNPDYAGAQSGLGRGFLHVEDYPLTVVETLHASSLGAFLFRQWVLVAGTSPRSRKSAARVNRDFLRWLPRNPDRPFFVFLNYYDAHDPYLPPPPFDARFAPAPSPPGLLSRLRRRFGGARGNERPPGETRALVDAYDGSIAYLDHQLGLLFAELERRRLLEQTLVVVVSDHGEQFGEHGLFGHGNSLYRQLLDVPLLISFPARVPAGLSIPEPASLRDLPVTVLDLLGLPDDGRFPGTTLARYWRCVPPAIDSAEPIISELTRIEPERRPFGGTRESRWVSVVLGGYHYIRSGDREELYDIDTDPSEERDLGGTEEGRQVAEKLRAAVGSVTAASRVEPGPPATALPGCPGGESRTGEGQVGRPRFEAPLAAARIPCQRERPGDTCSRSARRERGADPQR